MRHYQAGMERGMGEPVEQGWAYCDQLAGESRLVADNLRQSWEQPESDLSELAAMWYAGGLVYDCKQAFGGPGEPEHDIHNLIKLHPDADTRYEAEAALATIVRFDVVMEPYESAWERVVRRYRGEGGIETVCRLVREHEPDTVEAWHDWLWQPGASANDHANASMFAIAAARLASSTESILDLEPR